MQENKPNIIGGLCEFCGIEATKCIHHASESYQSNHSIAINVGLPVIPKIIYYTWVSDKPLPEKFVPFIEGWRKLMPDYEIRPITLENCPRNAWVDEAIAQRKFVLAGHYARCQRLYETGGIYCDIDIEAIKRFDECLNNNFFIGAESDKFINNAIFGCVPGHSFLKECMDYMDAFDINDKEVENETGPRMFTNLCLKRGWYRSDEDCYINDIRVYSSQHFYPYLWDKAYSRECMTPKTIAIHHWANTWDNEGRNLGEDLVSIVIPCYKQAQYLGEAIESALNQTYKNIEVIVVNDGSPDNTSEVAKRYPVRLIEKENGGVSSARNAGIKAAKGKWIATLDADDKIKPDFVKKTIGISDIVGTMQETFGDQERIYEPPNQFPTAEQEIVENQINCCSLFKREIWEKIGGNDEDMRDGYEDWDFWIRATQAGYRIVVVMEPLMLYRKHGVSMMTDTIKKDREIRDYMLAKYEKLWTNQ